MAQNKTLLELRTEIRNRGDFQSPYFTSTELTGYVNDSIKALYEYMAAADPARFSKEDSISVVSGTTSYSLPSDYYALTGVEISDSSMPSGRRQVQRFQYRDRNLLGNSGSKDVVRYRLNGANITLEPKPAYSATLYLDYIAVPAELVNDNDTFDSVISWTEWVVLDCLIKCANKEGSESQTWERRQRSVHMRIIDGGTRDRAEPRVISDTRGLRRFERRDRWSNN